MQSSSHMIVQAIGKPKTISRGLCYMSTLSQVKRYEKVKKEGKKSRDRHINVMKTNKQALPRCYNHQTRCIQCTGHRSIPAVHIYICQHGIKNVIKSLK